MCSIPSRRSIAPIPLRSSHMFESFIVENVERHVTIRVRRCATSVAAKPAMATCVHMSISEIRSLMRLLTATRREQDCCKICSVHKMYLTHSFTATVFAPFDQ